MEGESRIVLQPGDIVQVDALRPSELIRVNSGVAGKVPYHAIPEGGIVN